MTREIMFLEEKGIVQLRTSGTYELEAEVETLKKKALKLKEYNCNRCIFDHRKTEVVAKVLKSYERSSIYDELWGNRYIRAAIVLKELNEDFRFFETTVRNRGWDVKIFDNYDLAVNWLLEK